MNVQQAMLEVRNIYLKEKHSPCCGKSFVTLSDFATAAEDGSDTPIALASFRLPRFRGVTPTRPAYMRLPDYITIGYLFRQLVDHGCVDLSKRIDPTRYSQGSVDRGSFGEIWKGKLHDGTDVAIKVLRVSSIPLDGPKSLKRATREIYYWSKVEHKNVQRMLGILMFRGRLGMVSQWMEHGNLREYISKHPNADRYALCVQVAKAVEYLHTTHKMSHGDIKAINILVSRDGVAKLTDFDHSILSECSLIFSTSNPGGGTTRWMAPELILDVHGNASRNLETDIYALGMTMLEIITGAPPYHPECKSDVHVILAVMKRRLPKRRELHFGNNARDNEMWELLVHCWSRQPAARPTAAKVLKAVREISSLPTTMNNTEHRSLHKSLETLNAIRNSYHPHGMQVRRYSGGFHKYHVGHAPGFSPVNPVRRAPPKLSLDTNPVLRTCYCANCPGSPSTSRATSPTASATSSFVSAQRPKQDFENNHRSGLPSQTIRRGPVGSTPNSRREGQEVLRWLQRAFLLGVGILFDASGISE